MEIIVQKQELKKYEFNYEELKNKLILSLDKYQGLVVSDDAVKEAKVCRADLNKLKKEISDKVRDVKKEHNKPFDEFKAKTDELIKLIDEPVRAIDTQIKNFEEKQKDEKLEQIMQMFQDFKPESVNLSFQDIFDEKWLNATVTKKKVKEELESKITRIVSDLQIIESLQSEFEFAIKEAFSRNFNMSEAMQAKANLEARKLAEAEREAKLKAELARREELKKLAEAEREAKQQLDITQPPVIEPEQVIEIKTFTLEIVGSNDEKLEIENFLYSKGIDFKFISEKSELIGTEEIPF